MNKNHSVRFLLFTIIFQSSLSFGFASPCYLKAYLKGQTNELTQKIDPQAVSSYQQKLSTECDLFERFHRLKDKASDLFGIRLNQITAYQAIRYVDRFSYAKASTENVPVEVIYQVKKEDYLKPVDQRSSLVWRNWSKGNLQLDAVVSDLMAGVKIDRAYLEKVHLGFFSEDESGEYGNVFKAGNVKTFSTGVVSWKLPNLEQSIVAARAAQQINSIYEQMGLLPTTSTNGESLETNKILDVRDMTLFPGNPHAIEQHLENLTTFMNALLSQARQGENMVWKDRFFTPTEFAYFVQQYIVQIHAFYDGNGRTSRFWQDVILTLFGLPAGVSGDLSANDMLSTHEANYQLAIPFSFQQLQTLEECLESYRLSARQGLKPKKINLSLILPDALSYDCRLIPGE